MPRHSGPPAFFYRHWTAETPKALLVLLTGFGEHSGYFHRFAGEATRAGFDLWVLDHVGHGLTGDHDGLFESVQQLASNAQGLLTLARESQPQLPVFLLGHSLGGLTAIDVAAERGGELSGLVLTGPPVVGRPDTMPTTLTFSRDQTYIDTVRSDPLGITSPDAEANLWRAVSAYLPTMRDQLPRIKVPTLVVFGELDVFTTPDQARACAADLASSEVWIVEGSYHDILQDSNHRQVAARVLSFLDAQLR